MRRPVNAGLRISFRVAPLNGVRVRFAVPVAYACRCVWLWLSENGQWSGAEHANGLVDAKVEASVQPAESDSRSVSAFTAFRKAILRRVTEGSPAEHPSARRSECPLSWVAMWGSPGRACTPGVKQLGCESWTCLYARRVSILWPTTASAPVTRFTSGASSTIDSCTVGSKRKGSHRGPCRDRSLVPLRMGSRMGSVWGTPWRLLNGGCNPRWALFVSSRDALPRPAPSSGLGASNPVPASLRRVSYRLCGLQRLTRRSPPPRPGSGGRLPAP